MAYSLSSLGDESSWMTWARGAVTSLDPPSTAPWLPPVVASAQPVAQSVVPGATPSTAWLPFDPVIAPRAKPSWLSRYWWVVLGTAVVGGVLYWKGR